MSNAQDMRLLEKNAFSLYELNLGDLHNNAILETKPSGDSRGEDRRNATGLMDWTHAHFGKNAPKMYATTMKLQNFHNFVFVGIDFKSPLFEYTFAGHITEVRVHGYQKFMVDRAHWTPLTLTLTVLHSLLEIIAFPMLDEEAFLQRGAWHNDPHYRDCSEGEGRDTYVFQRKDVVAALICTHQSAHPGADPASCVYLHNLEVLPDCLWFFFFEDITFLSQFYPTEHILLMDTKRLAPLVKELKEQPHNLCFAGKIWFERKRSRDETLDKSACIPLSLPLRELSFVSMKKIQGQFVEECKTKAWESCAVHIYHILKEETFQEKHCYTSVVYLRSMCEGKNVRRGDFQYALDYLDRESIITMEDEQRVYLTAVYAWEHCIMLVMKSLLSRDITEKAMCVMEYESNVGDVREVENASTTDPIPPLYTSRGHLFCEEQQAAYACHLRFPLLMINGKAGSGKTDFLGGLTALYPLEELLASAFQAVNVGDLAKIFPGRAFTTDKLLWVHSTTCEYHGSSDWERGRGASKRERDDDDDNTDEKERKNEKDKKTIKQSKIQIPYKKCIFEKVKVLILDEMGTQNVAGFSKLLSALLVCGSLQKIIFSGDSRQLPSIHPGDLLRHLCLFLKEGGMLVEFQHNHRTHAGAQLLSQNADHIAAGDYDKLVFDQRSAIHIPTERHSLLQNTLVDVLTKYNITEYEHHTIARTNKVKTELITATEKYYREKQRQFEPSYRPWGKYEVGRKIMFGQNDYDADIVSNEILAILDISDVMRASGKGSSEHRVSHGIRSHTELWQTPGSTRELCCVKLSECSEKEILGMMGKGTLDRRDKRLKIIPWNDWSKKYIRRASATTTYAFQGAQKHTVIFVLPYACRYDTRELVYTAFTRPTHRLIFIGDVHDLRRACKNMETPRRSMLSQKLITACSALLKEYRTPDAPKNENDDGAVKHRKGKGKEEEEEPTRKRKEEAPPWLPKLHKMHDAFLMDDPQTRVECEKDNDSTKKKKKKKKHPTRKRAQTEYDTTTTPSRKSFMKSHSTKNAKKIKCT